jgi:hypothetical protein
MLSLSLLPATVMAQTSPPLTATGLQGQSLQLVPNAAGNAWDLHVNFNLDMPPNIAELAKSVPLYFVLNWKMSRPRWYWRDESLSKGQLYWRLSHNSLTQQWRMSTASTSAISEGRFALTFSTLNDALASLRRIRRDNLVKASELYPNQTYELTARLRLDTSLLPKPFQLNANSHSTNNNGGGDWSLDSGTLQTTITSVAPAATKR